MTDKPKAGESAEPADFLLRDIAGRFMFDHGYRGMTKANGKMQDELTALLAAARAEGAREALEKAAGYLESWHANLSSSDVARWLRSPDRLPPSEPTKASLDAAIAQWRAAESLPDCPACAALDAAIDMPAKLPSEVR